MYRLWFRILASFFPFSQASELERAALADAELELGLVELLGGCAVGNADGCDVFGEERLHASFLECDVERARALIKKRKVPAARENVTCE